MVPEINKDEIKDNYSHRYSLIVHEYFHVYQTGFSRVHWCQSGFSKVELQ